MTTCYFHYKKSEQTHSNNPSFLGISLVTILFSFISTAFYPSRNLITFFRSTTSFLFCALLPVEEEGSQWLTTLLYQTCAQRTAVSNFTPSRRTYSGCTCQLKPCCYGLIHSKRLNWWQGNVSIPEGITIFACSSFRSDKLRWISALSRPHAEIDFSAAQGNTKRQTVSNLFVVQSFPTYLTPSGFLYCEFWFRALVILLHLHAHITTTSH